MQYVEISSYVMRALEIICGQADQQGAELKDEALFRLIRKFREIRWITRTDLMNVRLQQLIERL